MTKALIWKGLLIFLDAGADEAPVIRFVNSIIFRAVKEKASDIHIEPYEKEVIYRFRVNGIMTEILRQPLKTQAAVSSRVKIMAKLDIAEKRTCPRMAVSRSRWPEKTLIFVSRQFPFKRESGLS